MDIHCRYDELKDPKELKNHPKNRNKHGQDQIERLAELYEYHGIRHPIIVSNLTGYIVAGHGRKLAAIRAGVTEMPVVYQDFDSDEQEYAFIQSDNAIALWAELDLSQINLDLKDLGPDFDLDMLGLKNFTLDFDGTNNKTDQEILNNYSTKIASPTYVPKREDPPLVSELFTTEKYDVLVKEIKSKKLPKEIEFFLINAASRHIVFNYENIAEFYCHQDKDIQDLMEKSALVIIDFKKAIEGGFVKLTEEIQEVFEQNGTEEE